MLRISLRAVGKYRTVTQGTLLAELRWSKRSETTLRGSIGKVQMKDGKVVVLIVEDSAIIMMGAVDLVLSAGYEAVEAQNADDAIAALEARDDIDLVFTDVQMPGTMDGIKLAHYIRDRWPPVRLIVASGAEILEESSLPTGSRFFPKPYRNCDIADSMAKMLAEDAAPQRGPEKPL